LTALGYVTTPQVYTVSGRAVRNIEATIEPRDPARARGTIVIGAHYDSYENTPGANDNATGTAAVLELARLLADLRGKADVRFRLVLFVNDEPPYFQTTDMGSYRYAQLMKERREPIIGMISLETMGYFRDEPGTQHYPPPFGLLYPSAGNFIAFVGMTGSRDFVRAAVQSFRGHTSFPSVGGVAPGFVPGIGWSDHWSFEGISVPALMITDTAPFRYAHYHELTDTPDKIDAGRLARITAGVDRLVRDMAGPQWSVGSAIGQ
jgi:Zn-dependent M28 family amino/carboxypeptidase